MYGLFLVLFQFFFCYFDISVYLFGGDVVAVDISAGDLQRAALGRFHCLLEMLVYAFLIERSADAKEIW